MKLKCVVVGGLVFFVLSNLVSFATGPLIHEGILDPYYQASENFWRPELRQDPPDMMSLMPLWLLNSLIVSLVVGWLYCACRGGEGPGWKRGLRFGLGLGIFVCALYRALSGVLDMPGQIWFWWGVEAIVIYALCGAGMGWAVGKWCAE